MLAAAVVAAVASGGALAGIASATPPPLDHQLCYTAAAPNFPPAPPGVVLKNALSPGFVATVTTVAIHCNPVQKTLPTGQVFPIVNPNAHLLCWHITAKTQPSHVVTVNNQFGSATLVTSQPTLLCLPSWKSLTGPPKKPRVQPPGLDHFTCYPVKVRTGSYRPPVVQLKDEFGSATAKVGAVPATLCMPTQKTVNGVVTKIIHPRGSLLCFPVSPTPIKNPVFDQNQFGTGTVTIQRTVWLCPPSTWKIIG
jgi:hypothetical protein